MTSGVKVNLSLCKPLKVGASKLDNPMDLHVLLTRIGLSFCLSNKDIWGTGYIDIRLLVGGELSPQRHAGERATVSQDRSGRCGESISQPIAVATGVRQDGCIQRAERCK
jgi:hypothetical protein